MKFIQHVPIDPSWPEFGTGPDGKPVRLTDVERLYEPGSDERAAVWFPVDGGRSRAYPWRDSGYYVDDAGEPIVPVGPDAPYMLRTHLRSLGFEDEELAAMHARYFGPPTPGTPTLTSARPDTPDLQVLRRRLFDEAMERAYAPTDK